MTRPAPPSLKFNTLASLLLLLGLLACGLVPRAALADEYGDVTQLIRTGKLPEARSRIDAFLATRPRDPQMRFLKGVIQRDTGQTTLAEATFTELTQDFPELPEPYNNLAVLYAAQNQFEKARLALEMAIKTNPGYSTAHENLGDVYAALAAQAYARARQKDTPNAALESKIILVRDVITKPAVAAPIAPAAPATAAPPARTASAAR
jgi:predicted Zn-dependent protease